jgi:hypothetical protein
VIPVKKNETGTENTGILRNPAGITNLAHLNGWKRSVFKVRQTSSKKELGNTPNPGLAWTVQINPSLLMLVSKRPRNVMENTTPKHHPKLYSSKINFKALQLHRKVFIFGALRL